MGGGGGGGVVCFYISACPLHPPHFKTKWFSLKRIYHTAAFIMALVHSPDYKPFVIHHQNKKHTIYIDLQFPKNKTQPKCIDPKSKDCFPIFQIALISL